MTTGNGRMIAGVDLGTRMTKSVLYDPGEDRLFNTVLAEHLKPDVPVVEIDANMEEPAFAEAVSEAARNMF